MKQQDADSNQNPTSVPKTRKSAMFSVIMERWMPVGADMVITKALQDLLELMPRKNNDPSPFSIQILKTTVLNPGTNALKPDCSIQMVLREEVEDVVVEPGASRIAARERMTQVMTGERFTDFEDIELMLEFECLRRFQLLRKQVLMNRLWFWRDHEKKMTCTEKEEIEWPLVCVLIDVFKGALAIEDKDLGIIAMATGVERWKY